MIKNSFGLDLPYAQSVNEAANELLRLGVRNQARMIVIAPTKPSEPLQVTCYARHGQAKVRFTSEQSRIAVAFCTRFKIKASMNIGERNNVQVGSISFWQFGYHPKKEGVVTVTAVPTKLGESIIIVF